MLLQTIVNGPFYNKFHTTNLDLGIVVLTMVNSETDMIDRIAHSKTAPAQDALKATPVSFKDIHIPLYDKINLLSKAIATYKPQKTSDWNYIFTPAINAETARFSQAEAGMGCSFIYPFKARNGGALIFSFYQAVDMIGDQHQSFMENYTAIVNSALSLNSV